MTPRIVFGVSSILLLLTGWYMASVGNILMTICMFILFVLSLLLALTMEE